MTDKQPFLSPPDKPIPCKLKRTVHIVPGGANRIIWTNELNGDVIGEVSFTVFKPEVAMALAQDFTAWLAEQLRAVAPAPAGILDHLHNGRGRAS